MPENYAIPELDVSFIFQERPKPVPPDHRPDRRIALLLLFLRKCCRSDKASLAKLHVLSWAVRTADTQESFSRTLSSSIEPSSIIVRIEPLLNTAIALAEAENLLTIEGGTRVQLTMKGTSLADDLWGTGSLLSDEKAFIAKVGKRLTEDMVSTILRGVA